MFTIRSLDLKTLLGREEGMLFETLLEAFLYAKKQGISGAKCKASAFTLANYRAQLNHFIHYMEDSKKRKFYKEVTRNDVRDFVEFVNNNPKWKSQSTRLSVLRTVRTLFHFIENDEECREEDLRGFVKVLPRIPQNPRRDYIPTTKELKDVRNSWDTDGVWGFRNFVMYSLMLGSGVRLGEVIWLKQEHLVQLEERMLFVPKEGKTGSRLIPLDEGLMRLLKKWIRERAKLKGHDTSEFIFFGRGGSQLTRNAVGQAFRKIQKDVPRNQRITSHVLRHSFGTYYLRNGGNMEKLRMMTGHTTYNALKGYLHLAQVGSEQIKQELDRVSPLKMLNGR